MGSMMLVECSACDAVVAAEALAQYTASLNPKLGSSERITFARCRECEAPLLVGQEYYGSDDGRRTWSDPYRLYPARDEILGARFPRAVRASHDEAMSCLKAHAFNAAALMCVRTLEAALADQHVQYETLAGGIAELRAQGFVDSRLHEWAEALPHLSPRLGEDTSRDEARDLVAFTEALLSYLYGVRARYNDFRTRQTTRSSAARQQESRPLTSEPTLAAVAAGSAAPPPNGDRPA